MHREPIDSGYVEDPYSPRRRATRIVDVGGVAIGGDHPIRVQSMTTTDTRDTRATVDQVERLADVGCEIVRITAPSLIDAKNLGPIRSELLRRGVRVPLVADIHFTPNAALVAAEHVEKVRINPGNFADKKKFAVAEYTDAAYAEEIERVASRFRPLVKRCRELGRALRIGTNHGSLSDRIMNRFGDTPLGMVESALEFLDVCEAESFFDIVFSMKSSNTQAAIHAYRLLAARLAEREPGAPSYPFHVGVTEAGDGEDGRIKSAIGIGSLLVDGIGDTIRVSLTEPPEFEVPVAASLARLCATNWGTGEGGIDPGASHSSDPYQYNRRETRSLEAGGLRLGGDEAIRVEIDLGPLPTDPKAAARELARNLSSLPELRCEGLAVQVFDSFAMDALDEFASALSDVGIDLPIAVRVEPQVAAVWPACVSRVVIGCGALISDEQLASEAERAAASDIEMEWDLRGRVEEISAQLDRILDASRRADLDDFAISIDADLPVQAVRLAAARLAARGAPNVPIVLRHRRDETESEDESLLRAAFELGAPLCDGIGDAVSLSGFANSARALDLAYRILQGSRRRTSRTEFISCPSCGRTLFDLVETTERIKLRTSHLVGVKIAIMGCIVNGPGEMADADFGYVGSGPGRVNLYVGKDLVARNVSDEVADDRLVELIREHGRWVDPAG
ncbi:MAG: (E)-4-hydroxy-3-methylbut-2-enyl-diphosphate synthase [Myxococcota bacterium]